MGTVTPDSPMFCTSCGARLVQKNAFCTSCGAPVAADAAAASGLVADSPRPGGGPSFVGTPSVAPSSPDRIMCESSIPYGASSLSGQMRGPVTKEQKRSNVIGIALLATALIVVVVAIAVVFFMGQDPEKETNEDANPSHYSESYANGKSAARSGTGHGSSAKDSATSDDGSATLDGDDPKNSLADEDEQDEYVLPDSGTREYSEAELSSLSDWELYIARNEIYARHGRGFNNKELADYFAGMSWYKELYTPEQFDAMPDPLNSIERSNALAIRSLEQKRGSEHR